MQTFTEHYFQEKFLSDVRRSLTSNLLKHRKTGIDLGKGPYKTVVPTDSSTFSRLKEDIRKEVVKVFRIQKQKETGKHKVGSAKRIKNEFGKLFVKNVLEGEIDSGLQHIEGDPVASIAYELSNGGKIAFVTTEDSEGMVRRYIATNSKGNDFFRLSSGTTLQQIAADSKKSSRLISKGPTINPHKEIERLIQSIGPEEPSETNEDSEIGIMDISIDEFRALQKIWGTGRKGGLTKFGAYPFFNKFTRGKYENVRTGYNGYKYSDKEGHNVYLIDTGDEENSFIAFDSRDTYDWAENIDMLNYWRSHPGDTSPISWKQGTIDTLE